MLGSTSRQTEPRHMPRGKHDIADITEATLSMRAAPESEHLCHKDGHKLFHCFFAGDVDVQQIWAVHVQWRSSTREHCAQVVNQLGPQHHRADWVQLLCMSEGTE